MAWSGPVTCQLIIGDAGARVALLYANISGGGGKHKRTYEIW